MAGFLNDWLVPIIIIIAVIVQFFAKIQKSPPPKPQREPPSPSPMKPAAGNEWEALLEALGKKPEAPAPPVMMPQKIVIPPPRLKPEMMEETLTARNRSKATLPSGTLSSAKEKMAVGPLSQLHRESYKRHRLLTMLRNRRTIRDAVVLNEILSPPLTFRG